MCKEKYFISLLRAGKYRWDGYSLVGPRGNITQRLKGYPAVSFRHKHKYYTVLIHRIVYRVFVGDIPSNMTVNHKNGIRDDNRPSNLELLSRADNVRHALNELGGRKNLAERQRGTKNINAVFTTRIIREIRQHHSAGASACELARRYRVSKPTMLDIVNNRSYVDPSYVCRKTRKQ